MSNATSSFSPPLLKGRDFSSWLRFGSLEEAMRCPSSLLLLEVFITAASSADSCFPVPSSLLSVLAASIVQAVFPGAQFSSFKSPFPSSYDFFLARSLVEFSALVFTPRSLSAMIQDIQLPF